CFAAIALGALGAAAWASFDTGGKGGVSVGRSAAGGPSTVSAARAGTARWRSLGGPGGGGVSALAIDPTDSKVVYADVREPVFKSTKGGASGRDVSQEPWTESGPLAIDPRHSSVIYVGSNSGVAKSLDGGHHWRIVNAGLFNRR